MALVLLGLLFNVLLIVFVYLIFRRKINRVLNGAELIDAIKDEVNHLVVDLNQTAERNIALIEERLERLKSLTDEADRKIMLLGKESEKVKFGADVYDKLKKAAAVQTPPAPAEPMEMNAPTEPNIAPSAVTAPERPAAADVLSLHRQGFDSKIIAARTRQSIGEVELIISLSDSER